MPSRHLLEALAPFANRRILVTGATGAIGARLVRWLLSAQSEVHALIRPTSTAWRLNGLESSSLIRHECIIDDVSEVQRIWEIARPDYVFHLATPRGTGQAIRQEMLRVNVGSAYALIESMRRYPCKGMVVAGSSMEYQASNGPLSEDSPLEPVAWFTATKTAANVLYLHTARTSGAPISIARLFHVYGPWESRHRLAPTALIAARDGGTLPVTTGVNGRDWIYVDDVCEALIKMALHATPGEVFNIGSGIDTTDRQFLAKVECVTQKKLKFAETAFPGRVTDASHRFADVSRARQRLGWEPRYTLEDGLAAQLAWIRENQAVMATEADHWEAQQ